MPVKETSKILESILSDITNTQNIVDKSKEVNQSLKNINFQNGKDSRKIVCQTRDIIDELTNEVLEISTKFYEFYDKEYKGIESDENLENSLNDACDIENCVVSTTEVIDETLLNSPQETVCTEPDSNADKNNKSDAENDEASKQNGNNKENEKSTENTQSKTSEIVKNNSTKSKETENENCENIALELENILRENSTVQESETVLSDTEPETITKDEKIWIRCVDISKLIGPDANDNSTVIVLSDSESNSTPIKFSNSITVTRVTRQAKNNNAKSPTKGVLKTPTSETPNSRKKKNVTFRDPETSDIDDTANTSSSNMPSTSKLPPRKTRPLEFHDISSLSEDSSDSSSVEEITSSKKQTTQKRKKGKRSSSPPVPGIINAKLDTKFAQKCVVKLVRMHPAVLKKNYEEYVRKNEVKRLTNMHSLKRNRKGRHNSSSSDSSSTSEKECKRPRTEKKASKPVKPTDTMDVSSSSDSDAPADTVVDIIESNTDLNSNPEPEPPTLEESNCDISEETQANILESLGNDADDRNSGNDSNGSNSNSDTEASTKKKKTEKENKLAETDVDNAKSKTESTSSGDKIGPGSKENNSSSAGNSEDGTRKNKTNDEKSKWRQDKLLTEKLDSPDSEEELSKSKKNKSKKKDEDDKSGDESSKDKTNTEKSKQHKDKRRTEELSASDSDNEEEASKKKQTESKKSDEKDKGKEKKQTSEDKEVDKEHNKESKDGDDNEKSKRSSDDESTDKDTESVDKGAKKKTSKEDTNTKENSSNKRNKEREKSDSDSSDESSTDEKRKKKDKTNNRDSNSCSDSDVVVKKSKHSKKKKAKKESDTDETFAKFLEKQDKLETSDAEEVSSRKKTSKRLVKKKRRAVVNSDSDSSSTDKKKSSSSDSESSKSSSSNDSKDKKPTQQTKRRRRIKKLKDSSDEDGEDKSTRKHIRKVWTKDSLAESTIAAEKEEAERKARILDKQKKYNQIFEPDSLEKSTVDKVVLDFEEEEELLVVHKEITKHLKPHQAKGVQFMWNTSFESVERAQKDKGSGCILAHCMGLGKTLQVITLIHTLLSNRDKTKIEKVLVVCPLSTVLNWVAEFKKWLPDDDEVNVFDIVAFKQNIERLYQIKEWDRCGGVLVLGYDMFRNLTNSAGKRMNKKMREGFNRVLVNPGPDLVVCDEGHLLKNEKTSLSIAMNRLKTERRIVLTGTPLQNNLKEYWCMVQFVKPNLLGTYKEYLNRFVNPIINGQYTDSTQHDIQLMRKRSHVLHKLLDGVVQRRDYSVLAPFLPPKHEYVLFVALTEKQIQLYEHYMKEKARRTHATSGGRTFLFVDFQELQRICTHPRVLLDKSIENKIARDKKELEEDESEGSLKDFIDDGSDKTDTPSSSNSSGSESNSDDSKDSAKKKSKSRGKRITRAAVAQGTITVESDDEPLTNEPDPLEWWREFVTDDDLDDILMSGKLTLLFEILRHCETIGDKVLIFSQSLYSLNVIEYFLGKVDDATQSGENGSFCGFSGSWSLGLDYFRLDGSSSCDSRAAWCNTFNSPENVRARLFLISTRAGGLGINLVAANRVIIFDVSWNPSHDTQSIYRVYRFGQNKPSYIYRFVTMGTMEMKIYERQVIKQAISKRVIDEQQIDRHYNQNDIAELYKFEPKPEGERPIPLVPVDVLLGELLQQDQKIYKYHEHQSLLENKEDEVLDEEERKAAWEEFENEKKARQYSGSINHIPIPSIVKALTSIMARESPALTAQMIQDLIPNMLQELQDKMAAGDTTLYNKVLAEIRLMQATVQQQRIEEYYRLQQQQQQNLLLQQFQQQMLVNPAAASQFMNQWGQQAYSALASGGYQNQRGRVPQGNRQRNTTGRPVQQPNAQGSRGQQTTSSTEVIELND